MKTENMTITILGVPVKFETPVKPKLKRKAKKSAASKLSLEEINGKLAEAATKPVADTTSKIVNTILAFVLYVGKRSKMLRMYGVCWMGNDRVGLRPLTDNGGDNALDSLSFDSERTKAFFVPISTLFSDLNEVSLKDRKPLEEVVAKVRYLATTGMKM